MSSRNAALEPTAMLTLYINRASKTLPKTQRARPERAKVELKQSLSSTRRTPGLRRPDIPHEAIELFAQAGAFG